ncbi:MAG: N-acetyltransferase [Anaerolineales bacterium]|nr:N-acetyltransferase [Anaerolineales bacterium]
MEKGKLVRNADKKRFELMVGDQLAYLEYIPAGQNIVLSHTEVPAALEGQGIGSQLVRQVLAWVRDEGKQIIIVCPFVAAFMQRHPENLDLVFGYRPREG